MSKKLNLTDFTGRDENNIKIDELIEKQIEEAKDDLISLLALQELLGEKNLKRVSRIKDTQVPALTKLFMFGDIFQSDTATSLADYILNLQISIRGLGRKELVSLVQKRDDNIVEEIPLTKKGLFR
jgi:hypothetical protein